MSDVQKYKAKRLKAYPEFAEGYEIGYQHFKIGVLLRMERERAGLTQDEIAAKLNTKKSVISRMRHRPKIRHSHFKAGTKAPA